MAKKVSWVENKIWLSSLLYCFIYGVIGWNTYNRTEILLKKLREVLSYFDLNWGESISVVAIQLLVLVVVVSISLIFVHPLSIVTFIFEESINSDVKGFIVILFWSLLLVFILCYFNYFADILVVTSSTILFRFDLKYQNLSFWQTVSFTVILAVLSYSFGLFLHNFVNS